MWFATNTRRFEDLIRKVNVTLFPVDLGGGDVEMSPYPLSNKEKYLADSFDPYHQAPKVVAQNKQLRS